MQNCFIKLILIPMNDGDHLPLFGFCVPTSQEFAPWHTLTSQKHRQERCVWRATLQREELEVFLDSATRPGIIRLNDKCSFSSPQWIRRPTVLANDGQQRQPGPVSGFMLVDEYWDAHKAQTARRFEDALKNCPETKALFGDAASALAWVKAVCGIDFLKHGEQFGNFNHYRLPALADGFEIDIDKNSGLVKTTVSKKIHIPQRLLVNCVAECRGRTICNQTKVLTPDEDSIAFHAVEPMSHITVQIWDADNSDLVFSKDITLMRNITIDMAVRSTPLIVQDPWTTGIKKAASNRAEQVQRSLETVCRSTHQRQISVSSEVRSDLDVAFEEGGALFKALAQDKCRGAFIPAQYKDGEIEAFLTLRRYLDDPILKAAAIVDPYFSVEAAAKLLTRIQNAALKLDIITSLGIRETAEGQKINEAARFKDFLDANASILHKPLRIRNLTRGTGSAFHDRYLLRCFADGHTDGLLLSNSINSMGASNPFVIAPMEQPVLEGVRNYLHEMLDTAFQQRIIESLRIDCETLLDGIDAAHIPPEAPVPEPKPWHAWFPEYADADEAPCVPRAEIPSAVDRVWTHWPSEPKNACKALCELASDSPEEVAEALKRIDGASKAFITEFSVLSSQAECRQHHERRAVDDPTFQLWALLNDRAEPSIGSFYLWFREVGHICYTTDTWLYGGYSLLLWLDATAYAQAMNTLKSPLAFDRLAFRLLFYPWSEALYGTILTVRGILPQLLCAEWLFAQAEKNALDGAEIAAVLSALPRDACITQSAYLVSRITFFRRVNKSASADPDRWRALYDQLLTIIADGLCSCPPRSLDTVSKWLTDCEVESHCRLLMDLVARTDSVPIRKHFLEQIGKIARKALQDRPGPEDMPGLTDLLLRAYDALYGSKAEPKLRNAIASRDDLEYAAEPALKDYNYRLWHCAHIRAVRQMALLRAFMERHPEAGPNRLLRDWEARINLV